MIAKNFDINAALLKAKLEAETEVQALEQYIWNRERSDDYFYSSAGYKAAKAEINSFRWDISELEELL